MQLKQIQAQRFPSIIFKHFTYHGTGQTIQNVAIWAGLNQKCENICILVEQYDCKIRKI